MPCAFKINYEIEYHYLRIYVYSITIQAIVERPAQFSFHRSPLNPLNAGGHAQNTEEYKLLKEVR